MLQPPASPVSFLFQASSAFHETWVTVQVTQGAGTCLKMFLSLRWGGQDKRPKEQGPVGARGSPEQPVKTSWHKS